MDDLLPTAGPDAPVRPTVRGKFLWLGDRKLYVRGVTYGTFRPGEDGSDYPAPERVDADLAAMAAHGFNAVRTYTVPPRWLLDAAARHGLLVMVGLPWEQHVAFLDERSRRASIEARVRAGVRACAGHPAVLCYAIGNEIPASIVRWYGRRRVSRFLERLYRAAKDEDPGGLVTYVNFPTTEYLELGFLDFCSFNVYLESERELAAYVARLQVVAGDRPLVMAEIGLDSRRNGEDGQAASLEWQLRCVFGAGCAGATVFAWTDEWHRGGYDVDDWDFGLTRRDRSPKPALGTVSRVLAELPAGDERDWPRVSVVVCSYNGSRTIGECLEHLAALDYPDYEVVVVDDGSTDGTADLAARYDARVVTTPNRGLSSARNTGALEATGEIVAYVDDDAYPDPHWLRYLALTFMTSEHRAVGGPNLPPADDCAVARCVADAPGGPVHVLLSDTVAEHLPGCNLAVRRDALLEIGGFDPQFRVAGDDVDVCWRLQERGWTIGFSPAAQVWHRRRGSVRAFWRQQRGYGRAEAMLERKWPAKYNGAGHLTWLGRIYEPGRRGVLERWRVYYGTWGSGAFQRLYAARTSGLASLPLMPEWLLLVAALTVTAALGAVWRPLLLAAPLAIVAVVALLLDAWRSAGRGRFARAVPGRRRRVLLRGLTAGLHLLHAVARLWGRVEEGLAPWGRRARPSKTPPVPRVEVVWSERWRAPEAWLAEAEARLLGRRVRVRRGGDFDRWDLEVRGGALGRARVRMAVEEHGGGRQQLRFRLAPRFAAGGLVAAIALAGLGIGALADGAPAAAAVLLSAAAALELEMALAAAGALAAARATVRDLVPAPDASNAPAAVRADHGEAALAGAER